MLRLDLELELRTNKFDFMSKGRPVRRGEGRWVGIFDGNGYLRESTVVCVCYSNESDDR